MSLLSIAHRLWFAAASLQRIQDPERFMRDLLDIVNAKPIDVVKEWSESGRRPSSEEVAEFVAAGLNEMVRRRADDPEDAPQIAFADGAELMVNMGFFDRLREMDHSKKMRAVAAMFRAIRETGHRMLKEKESAPGDPPEDVPAEPEIPVESRPTTEVPPSEASKDAPIIIHPELWDDKTKHILGTKILVDNATGESRFDFFQSVEEAENKYGPLPRKTKKGIEIKDPDTGEYRLVGKAKPKKPKPIPESAEPPETPKTEPSPPPPAENRKPAPKMPPSAAPLASQMQEALPLLRELWAFRADMARQTDYNIQNWMVNRTVERFEKILGKFGIEVAPVGRIQKRTYRPDTDNQTIKRLADILPEIMRYEKYFDQAELGTIPMKTLSEWLDDFIDWNIDAEQAGGEAEESEAVRTSSFDVLHHCHNRMATPLYSLDGRVQVIASEVLQKQALQLSKGNIRASKDGTIMIDPGFTNCPVVKAVTRELQSKQSDMGAMKKRLEDIGMLVTGGAAGQLNVYCLAQNGDKTRMCQYFVDAHGMDGKFKIECAYKG